MFSRWLDIAIVAVIAVGAMAIWFAPSLRIPEGWRMPTFATADERKFLGAKSAYEGVDLIPRDLCAEARTSDPEIIKVKKAVQTFARKKWRYDGVGYRTPIRVFDRAEVDGQLSDAYWAAVLYPACELLDGGERYFIVEKSTLKVTWIEPPKPAARAPAAPKAEADAVTTP